MIEKTGISYENVPQWFIDHGVGTRDILVFLIKPALFVFISLCILGITYMITSLRVFKEWENLWACSQISRLVKHQLFFNFILWFNLLMTFHYLFVIGLSFQLISFKNYREILLAAFSILFCVLMLVCVLMTMILMIKNPSSSIFTTIS